jgi:hypothetical protein
VVKIQHLTVKEFAAKNPFLLLDFYRLFGYVGNYPQLAKIRKVTVSTVLLKTAVLSNT